MWLKNSICEKDSVILIYYKFNMSPPCEIIVHTSVIVLGSINRGMVSSTEKSFIMFFSVVDCLCWD